MPVSEKKKLDANKSMSSSNISKKYNFLGLTGCYRNYINYNADITYTPIQLLRKDEPMV